MEKSWKNILSSLLEPCCINPNCFLYLGAGSSEYGMVLLGVLIMQDVLLGVLMALLPSMADNSGDSSPGGQALAYLLLTLRLAGGEHYYIILYRFFSCD